MNPFLENSHIKFSNDEEEIHNYEYCFQKELGYEKLENPFIAGYDLSKFDKYCKNTIHKQFFCSFAQKGVAKLTQKFFHDSEFSIFITPQLDDEEEEEEGEEPVEIQSTEEQAIKEES